MSNEIVIYNPSDSNTSVQLQADYEARQIWATQKQIAQSLGLTIQAVNQQIANFKQQRGAAAERSIKHWLIVAEDGKQREVEHYDTTVIAFVGFRAKATDQTIAFQDWVGEILNRQIATKPMSNGDLLVAMAESFRALEQKVDAVVDRLDDKEFLSIDTWCRVQGIKEGIKSPAVRSMWGKEASALSRASGIEIKKALDEPHAPNRYHVSILQIVCVAKPKTDRQLQLIGGSR